MKHRKTNCIVLKSSIYREIDKTVTLISPDIGIFYVTAYGACKSKTRYGGKLEPFTVLNADLAVKTAGGKTEYRFVEITPVDFFDQMTSSYEKSLTAQFFCEVLLKNNTAGEDRQLFALLYQSLKALNHSRSCQEYDTVFNNYLIRYLSFTGFFSPLTECSGCGRTFDQKESICIEIHGHQPLCRSCIRSDFFLIDAELKNYINKILTLKLKESLSVPINNEHRKKLKTYLISHLKDISGFRYKTLESFR